MFIGSRDNIVPLVHVSDLVQAMLLAAKLPTDTSRVFNITDGSATTIGELVSLLAKAVGSPRRTRCAARGCAAIGRVGVWLLGPRGAD